MTTLTADLLALAGQASALGGFCYLVLGQFFAWTDQRRPPLGRRGKLWVSLGLPFAVAFAAYLTLAGLGAAAWDWPTANQVGTTALLAVLGAQGWHASAARVSDHLEGLLTVVLAQTVFLGPAEVRGILAGGNVTPGPAPAPPPPPEEPPHAGL